MQELDSSNFQTVIRVMKPNIELEMRSIEEKFTPETISQKH